MDTRGENTARAIEQVKLYEKVTEADRVFLVLPKVSKNSESKGVVSARLLTDSIRSFFEQGSSTVRPVRIEPSNKPTVFAAMPSGKALGIDEIQWRRGHKYLTLVYQIDAERKRCYGWVESARRRR